MSDQSLTIEERLKEEAKAFDEQIDERINSGHIPDIRRAEPCTYFYNNSWRHPEYVKLDFGNKFNLIKSAILQVSSPENKNVKILEVGCGPGHISLELARAGFDVIGLDLSAKCVEVAEKFAKEDPWGKTRGNLQYLVDDFLSPDLLEENHFDFIVFVGALHHFPDQAAVCQQCRRLLNRNGHIIALEPTRDRVTRGNAIIFNLIQTLLSAGDGYYKKVTIPSSLDEQDQQIMNTFNTLRYEDGEGGKVQSVNDNEAGYEEMLVALKESFTQVSYKDLYGLFHEIIGGLRFDQDTNNQLARYIRDVDRELCDLGVVQATEFLFVGRAA